MPDENEDGSLSSLDARISKARAERNMKASGGRVPDKELDGLVGTAFRIGTELVAALVVALLIGWALDRWLGTRPWLMIVFFFLGAGTGILNVYRAANGITFGAGSQPKK